MGSSEASAERDTGRPASWGAHALHYLNAGDMPASGRNRRLGSVRQIEQREAPDPSFCWVRGGLAAALNLSPSGRLEPTPQKVLRGFPLKKNK